MFKVLSNNILEQSIDFSQGICLTESFYWDSIRIFAVIILVLAAASIFLNFRLFYQLFRYIQIIDGAPNAKQAPSPSFNYDYIYEDNIKYERELTIRKRSSYNPSIVSDTNSLDFAAEEQNKEEAKKLKAQVLEKFFSFWYIFHVIGNFVQTAGAILMISNYSNLYMESLLLGLGTFMCWITSLRFIAKTPQYYVLFKTIELSAPTIAKVLFGTFPVYIGYALTGACLFWRSERFNCTQASLISLLPMFWGNNIYDNYNSITGYLSVFSQMYIYGFAIFFSCIVFNVFIATVTNQYGKVLDMVDTEKRNRMEKKENLKKLKNLPDIPVELPKPPEAKTSENGAIKFAIESAQSTINKMKDILSTLPPEEKRACLEQNRASINALIQSLQELNS